MALPHIGRMWHIGSVRPQIEGADVPLGTDEGLPVPYEEPGFPTGQTEGSNVRGEGPPVPGPLEPEPPSIVEGANVWEVSEGPPDRGSPVEGAPVEGPDVPGAPVPGNPVEGPGIVETTGSISGPTEWPNGVRVTEEDKNRDWDVWAYPGERLRVRQTNRPGSEFRPIGVQPTQTVSSPYRLEGVEGSVVHEETPDVPGAPVPGNPVEGLPDEGAPVPGPLEEGPDVGRWVEGPDVTVPGQPVRETGPDQPPGFIEGSPVTREGPHVPYEDPDPDIPAGMKEGPDRDLGTTEGPPVPDPNWW